MLDVREFGDLLSKKGFNFFTGVPCSYLKDLINFAINEKTYIGVSNEGEAVSIAAGVWLTGNKSSILIQNSGISNALSPICSLINIYQIPILGFVGFRGKPGTVDEPQHRLTGKITKDLLKKVGITCLELSNDINIATEQMNQANEIINSRKSFFFLVENNTFQSLTLLRRTDEKIYKKIFLTRYDTINAIVNNVSSGTAIFATTGMTGRELYEIKKRKLNFYMTGAMGCVSSIAIGVSIGKPNLPIVIIDGDGALIMRMGSLSTNGYLKPKNTLHILLDNQQHQSTGGQSTNSKNINFIKLAKSCGYNNCFSIKTKTELEIFIRKWIYKKEFTFLYLKINAEQTNKPGRPKETPLELIEDFKSNLN